MKSANHDAVQPILAEQDLIALGAVDEAGFFTRIWDAIVLMVSGPG